MRSFSFFCIYFPLSSHVLNNSASFVSMKAPGSPTRGGSAPLVSMDSIEDESVKQFLSPSPSETGCRFGDPQLCPRVGDEYQAKIPPLMEGYTPRQLKLKSIDIKVEDDVSNSFLLGLPIPVIWSNNEIENSKHHSLESCGSQAAAVDINGSSKFVVSGFGGLANPEPATEDEDDKIVIDRSKGCCSLFPGSSAKSWSEIEHNSFVLGLYIFGKNFLPVKRFMENKKMGEILSFYYGEFYRSNAYRRWSECRKMKSRRCIHGQKIFTGWRQQELLSRLFSHVSEPCKNHVVEITRAYGQGKFLLEEYASSLKDAVGVQLLIKAVGIGKGSQDLTGIATEPRKPHRVFSLRPEIPVGKACSTLTSEDIIKFLTGDCRLSKARSSDLFWEAVWPRLLAKGWHSEMPDDQSSSSSKPPLVFLIPGIKKFSRRKLVKGNHYFDSVSDILTEVVSDPGLLELEDEAAEDTEKKEESSEAQTEENRDDLSTQKRHIYLQPRTSRGYHDRMKFTIVDTSSVYGEEEETKLIALKSLPSETADVFTHPGLFNETEENTPEYEHGTEATNASVPAENSPGNGPCVDSHKHVSSIPISSVPSELCLTIEAVESHEGHATSVLKGKKKSRKMKSVHSNLLAPVPKRPRVFGNGESSRQTENQPAFGRAKEEQSRSLSNSPDPCREVVVQVVITENLSSSSSSAKQSPEKSNASTPGESSQSTRPSSDKSEPRQLIDLNVLPSNLPEFAVCGTITMETVANHGDLGANKSSVLPKTGQQSEQSKLLDGESGRRHSTRNRPLSTKALEALVSGFFSTTRKRRRGGEVSEQKSSTPRSSQRVRGRTAASENLKSDAGSNITNSRIGKLVLDGASASNTKVVDESQDN